MPSEASAMGGGDAVNKTVGVHVKATSDLSGLDVVIAKLREIDALAKGVGGNINITNSFNGAAVAAEKLAGNTRTAKDAALALSKAEEDVARNAQRAADASRVQGLELSKRVTTTSGAGDVTQVETKVNAAKTYAQAVSSTGALRTTQTFETLGEQERRGELMANMAEQRIRRVQQVEGAARARAIDDEFRMRDAASAEDMRRTEAAVQRKLRAQQQLGAVQARETEAEIRMRRAADVEDAKLTAAGVARKQTAQEQLGAIQAREAERDMTLRRQAYAADVQVDAQRATQAQRAAQIQSTLAANTAKMQAISQSTGLPITRNLIHPEQLQILQSSGAAVMTLNETTGAATLNMRSLQTATAGFGGELVDVIGKVALWSVATGAIFGTIHAVKEAIATYAAFELQTVTLARVGDNLAATQAGVSAAAQQTTRDILDLKVAYGSTGTAALEAGVVFARLGYNQAQIKNATEQVLTISNLSGSAPQTVATQLEAMMLQFQKTPEQINAVTKALIIADTQSRLTAADLLGGASRAGSAWHELGGTLEELNAVMATIGDTTGRPAGEIGNAIKFIGSRLPSGEVTGKIYELTKVSYKDIEGNLKPIAQYVNEVAAAFKNLTQEQRADLEVTFAGGRQWNSMAAWLNNTAMVQQKVTEQMDASSKAGEYNAAVMDTLSKRWDSFQAAVERSYNTSLQGGVGRALKVTLAVAQGYLALIEMQANVMQGKLTLEPLRQSTDALNSALGITDAAMLKIQTALDGIAEISPTLAMVLAAARGLEGLETLLGGEGEEPPLQQRHDANVAAIKAAQASQRKTQGTPAEPEEARIRDELKARKALMEEAEASAGVYSADKPEEYAQRVKAITEYESYLLALQKQIPPTLRESLQLEKEIERTTAERVRVQGEANHSIANDRIGSMVTKYNQALDLQINMAKGIADVGPEWGRSLAVFDAELETRKKAHAKLLDDMAKAEEGRLSRNTLKYPEAQGIIPNGASTGTNVQEEARAAIKKEEKALSAQIAEMEAKRFFMQAEADRKHAKANEQEARHVANMLMQMSTSDILQTALLLGKDEKDVWKPKSMGDLARMDEQERRTWMNASKVQGEGGFFGKTIEDIAAKAREASNTRSITNDVMTTRAHEVGHATVASMSIGTVTANGIQWKAVDEQTGSGAPMPKSERSSLWYTPSPQFLIPNPGPQEPAVKPPTLPSYNRATIGEQRGGGGEAGAAGVPGQNVTVNVQIGGLVADGDKLSNQVALLVSNAVDGVADRLIARVQRGADQTALKGGQPLARVV